MKRRLDDKEGKAREIKEAFLRFKREIFVGAENSRTGKPIPSKLIKAFEETETEKDAEMEKMRLGNISRRNHLRKLEQTLRQKEKLADGLHLIDFEQLKARHRSALCARVRAIAAARVRVRARGDARHAGGADREPNAEREDRGA